MKEALEETLDVVLYQEQVLRVAHDLAGLSYAEADGFRRAMTHDRTAEEMEKMRLSFINSSLRQGVSRSIAGEVFEQLAAFAAYGFCKAHAAAYAILSYQTLWLKCHYPAEFFAAVLSNQPMGYYPPSSSPNTGQTTATRHRSGIYPTRKISMLQRQAPIASGSSTVRPARKYQTLTGVGPVLKNQATISDVWT